MLRDSGLAAIPILRAALRDLLEEAHREEVPQPVDARVVRRSAVLLVEAAQAAVPVAAELVESAFVAGIVDRRRHARRPFWGEEDVVVCRTLRRKLHDVSEPYPRRSITR